MDRKGMICLAAGVVLFVIVLFWTRYQVIPVHAMNGVGFYKLNRITGQVTLVTGLEQINILKVRDFEIPQTPAEPPAAVKPDR
jgi:hypothetical protein